jgi:hypothetical protein
MEGRLFHNFTRLVWLKGAARLRNAVDPVSEKLSTSHAYLTQPPST